MTPCDQCKHFRADPLHKGGLCAHPSPRAPKAINGGLPACVVVRRDSLKDCFEGKK